ncbi:MAG: metallophosphoesterase [Planctomycetes bacterium]|nr:metallophosphoesterase [Planctomycetota bacterium]
MRRRGPRFEVDSRVSRVLVVLAVVASLAQPRAAHAHGVEQLASVAHGAQEDAELAIGRPGEARDTPRPKPADDAPATAPPAQDSRPKDDSRAEPDGPFVRRTADGRWKVTRLVPGDAGPGVVFEVLPRERDTLELVLAGRPYTLHLRGDEVAPPVEHAQPETLLVLSDIEGNLDAFVALLRAANAIDEHLDWSFGKGHVVLAGDFVDRGLKVTECLWLAYELEGRARKAGGGVHFILGNHEVMNLTGDLRYVRRKYVEAAALMGETVDALYARDTVLGRWLRTRNAIERIGDSVYVHGGISPAVAATKPTVKGLADALRDALLAETWTKPKEGLLAAAAGKDGLTWYRNYVQEPVVSESEVDGVLAAFGVKRVVVGHTIVPRVGLALGGRVLTVDVHHAGGNSQAALLEKGAWVRLFPDGRREGL